MTEPVRQIFKIKTLVQITIVLLLLLIFLLPKGAFCLGEVGTLQEIDQLLNQSENQLALQLLEELPDSMEGKLWRMARLHYEMGRLAKKIPDKMKFFQQAEKYARDVIAVDSENSEGYKWLAIALGGQSKYSSTKEQIHQSREIKENIDKAIKLNPDDDISYLVLSRWNYKISALGFFSRTIVKIVYGGLPKASLNKAEQLLWKAIKLHDRMIYRYNLAKVYYRMGRREDAITQLNLALSIPTSFPEEVDELRKAKKKLRQWQQKDEPDYINNAS